MQKVRPLKKADVAVAALLLRKNRAAAVETPH
jgi:hypothetical protein